MINFGRLNKALYLVRMTSRRRSNGSGYYSQAVIDKREEDLLMAAYDLVQDPIGPNGGFLMRDMKTGEITKHEFFGYAERVMM